MRQLVKYLKQGVKQGHSYDDLKEFYLSHDVPEQEIDKAIEKAKKKLPVRKRVVFAIVIILLFSTLTFLVVKDLTSQYSVLKTAGTSTRSVVGNVIHTETAQKIGPCRNVECGAGRKCVNGACMLT